MTHTKRFHVVLSATASFIVLMSASSCASQRSDHGAHTVWFVHATDPHRYLYTAEDATDSIKKSTAFQESQDREALSAFLHRVRTLPQTSGPPAFILITGDFGVDPCLIPNADTLKKQEKTRTLDDCVNKFDTKKREDEIEEFSQLFVASPVRNIYFVAGNNDLPLETADDAGIAYFNQFFQDVQSKISAKNSDVRLHNLTGCYGSKAGTVSDCSSDIPGTTYRMIGFPSYSFKNNEPGHEKNPPLQAAQFATFQGLLDQAIQDRKKVIIATHIPEIDDPYYLARDRYNGIKAEPSIDTDKDNPRSPHSTWNVQRSLLDEWSKVLASDSVVAVLAGHIHDGHKEIYQRAYSWSTLNNHQMGFRKLFLAPPLSVKNQDGSPIQARGFSVVSLHSDHLSNRFYWYDGLTAAFNPDTLVEPESRGGGNRSFLARLITPGFAWLWRLDETVLPLERMATLLIALLTAFLTVIALWQIPPSDDPLAKKPASTDSKDANTDSKTTATAKDSSPFTTRFGATVLAGLGGLVVTEVTKTLGGSSPSPDTKWYYIVCFIFFFFFLLLSLNILRGVVEAMRSRVAVVYYPFARLPRQSRFSHRVARLHYWFLSLRVPILTFFDTFINLIQGKNQTTTQAFTKAIIEQQRNVIRVSDTIRKKLNALLQLKLRELPGPGDPPTGHVRVNISVLSADQSNVFYISRTAGSALLPFSKISVAWVSVFTGTIRWYESFYREKNILLFDNSDNIIPDAPKQLMLDSYYEDRHDDYEAFVVLPVPQPQRTFGSKYVKGAIHISFSSKDDFEKIWSAPAVHVVTPPGVAPAAVAAGVQVPPAASAVSPAVSPAPVVPPLPASPVPYPRPDHILGEWCPDPRIQTALNDAVAVLGELLHGFNEVIYSNYIQPNQGD